LKKQRGKSQAKLNKPQSHRPQGNDAEKARAYAFLLLKFRLRSEAELKARLKQKGFSEELSQDTVNFLKDREFIDDRVFAKGWVASRLKRPLGIRRIKQELIAKGLDQGIIEDSLAQAKKNYSEDQIVGQLAQQRFSRLSNIEPQKAKARLYAYLLRRGFSPDVVSEIIKQL